MSRTRRVLLCLLALALLRRPIDFLLAAMLPDVTVNPIPQCIAGVVMNLLLLGLPAWLLRPWTSDRLGCRKSALPGMAMGAAAAVLTRWALAPADAAWQEALNLVPDTLPVPQTIPVAMLYIASLAVIPAVMEEAFFRGAVLTGLLDGGRRVTVVLLTSVSFALMHASLANLPSLLVLSLLLTLLMLDSGHMAVPVTVHLVYNLTALSWMTIPGWGSLLCGAGLIGLGAYLCVRQPRYAHQPMRLTDGLIAAAAVIVLAAAYIV